MRAALATAKCLAAGGPACAAGDAYYVAVFAERSVVRLPRYSHSFAAFAHVTPDSRPEAFAISWLPRTVEVRPFALGPEEGRNFDLRTTLLFCWDNRIGEACWGPYQVDADLWRRALWQKGRLEAAQVLYKAFDDGSPDGGVSNCVHAISAIAGGPGGDSPDVVVMPEIGALRGVTGSPWRCARGTLSPAGARLAAAGGRTLWRRAELAAFCEAGCPDRRAWEQLRARGGRP